LQSVEELVEEFAASTPDSLHQPEQAKQVMCIPARDFADEIACKLAEQVLSDTASVRIVAADSSIANIQELASRLHPDVLCVVGVPPRAVRHIKMRCHQIRARFPDAVVLACVLSDENDLSSLRSRIPAEDAQHVVCSLQLMRDYLISLLHPTAVPPGSMPETEGAIETAAELKEESQELRHSDAFDGPLEGMFNRLAVNLARSFDAPIAMITAAGGEKSFWEAQCGLPDDTLSSPGVERARSICGAPTFSDSIVVIADIEAEGQFTEDPFIKDHGIRFYAGSPIKAHDGKVIGSICVLDTRPRQITDKQKETLVSVAESVMMAIELSEPMQADTLAAPEEVSLN
jgi:hypothetical protein